MFYKGKRGKIKIDPYRMTLKFSINMDPKIVAVLKELFGLFFRKTIQNNIAEGSNSMIQSLLKLCGSKTESSMERKIRAFVIIRNETELLYKIRIDMNIRGDFIINDLVPPELALLMSQVDKQMIMVSLRGLLYKKPLILYFLDNFLKKTIHS